MMTLATKKLLVTVTCLLPAYLYRQQWVAYKEKKKKTGRKRRNGSSGVLILYLLVEIGLTTSRDPM